eukprot:834413-Pleurochrysis_carterae.AAC.1
MVMTNFERCFKAGEYLLELAEFGHRLTVMGFGGSPHDGVGLTYRSFILELHHFYKFGRSLQGSKREAHLEHLVTCYRDTLSFAGDAAKATLLSAPDDASFGPLIPMRDLPSLRLLRSYEARREHMDDTLATMTQSAPAPGKATRRAAQQLTQTKEAPGSKAHLVCYDGNVVSIGNNKFSIKALRHKLGNDICLPVALLRTKANPLPVCDCYGQPGHGELEHGAHKIPHAARAIADAARLRSNKRVTPQPADEERTAQRQRQARAKLQQRRSAWKTSEMLSSPSWSPSALTLRSRVARGARSCLTPPPFSPAPQHLPQPHHATNAWSAASAATGRQGKGAWRRRQRQGEG